MKAIYIKRLFHTVALWVCIIAFVISNSAQVFAAAATQDTCDSDEYKQYLLFPRTNNIPYYLKSCCGSDSLNKSAGSTPASSASADCAGKPLPDTIPKFWRELIDKMAAKYPDTDRRTVAAELWIENRGWPDPNKNWAVSSASAQGPMQFIPSSWASMGQDCGGKDSSGNITDTPDGVKDANNPADAVCAAFVHNKGTACKPIMEGLTGDTQADYNNVPFYDRGNDTLLSSIRHYNGSGAPDGVALGQMGSGQNSNYIKMAYWLLVTDFKQSINVDNGSNQMVDATTAGSPNAANGAVGTAQGTTSSQCAAANQAAGGKQ